MKISLNGNKTFQITDLTPQQFQFISDTFKYQVDDKEYDWKRKKWNFHAKKVDITCYTVINIDTIQFPMGYIFAVVNSVYPQMDKDNLISVMSKFKNTEFSIQNYYNLEDRNNTYSNLNTLIRLKRGMLQIPTGSGKTEMIATITKNILDRFEKVLIISETTPVLDEIRLRLQGLGVNTPKYFDKDNLLNIIKPTGFCRNGIYNKDAIKDYFNDVKYLIADEVETTVTPSFESLFEHMPNCEYLYGFSASTNKSAPTDIPKDHTLKDKLNPHIDKVVKYYGYTSVDSRPTGFDITVKVCKLDINIHQDIEDRHIIIRKFFGSDQVRDLIAEILSYGDTLFVPVNQKLPFYNILDDSRINKYNVMLITGDGYTYYESGKSPINLSLEDCKYKVSTGDVNLILGTITSYRGIDFRNVTSVLLTFDAQSAIVRQCIGRLTRQTKFNIYLVKANTKIHFLSSAFYNIQKEIKEYYALCKLKFINM